MTSPRTHEPVPVPVRPSAARVRGLRAVAVYEGSKGLLVLLVGFGLLRAVHHDAQRIAEGVVRVMHVNPAHRVPRVFITAASRVSDGRLRVLAAVAFVYAVVRVVEAVGLWQQRAWARWLGVVSGGMYLPVEVWSLARRPTVGHAAVLMVNLAIVVYLARARTTNTDRSVTGRATPLQRVSVAPTESTLG